jgi:hypothetical protein
MQAAKTPGLAEEVQGEQTKWQKTYGKRPPCHVISCIPGTSPGLRGSDRIRWLCQFHRMTEAGRHLIPAQRMSGVNWNYPLTGRDTAKSGMGQV